LKISYGITVCKEDVEIQRLVTFLLENKRNEDEIVVTYDSTNGSKGVEEYLRSHSVNGEFAWHSYKFDNDYAKLKNFTKKMCGGDYIFHIDADEYPHETLIEQLPQIIELNDVDLIWIPRVNTVDGFTDDDVKKWGWRITENGWVNYPDYQARVFRNTEDIMWVRPLHEYIIGCKTYAHLPPHEELSLYHPKTKEKQEEQNLYYNTNFSKQLNVRKV
jgi:glycosyltransferase involved in cell wall biosynthesis|tara:strand:- start:1139 stop:1789 length:651 start_codon:yes stop_codon:yes gene_type:complete